MLTLGTVPTSDCRVRTSKVQKPSNNFTLSWPKGNLPYPFRIASIPLRTATSQAWSSSSGLPQFSSSKV